MTHYAKLEKRVLSALVDYVIYYSLFFIYVSLLGTESEDGGMRVTGWLATPIFIFWIALFPILEGITGQTLGKMIFGTRVVTSSGREINIGISFTRHLLQSVDLFFGLTGILSIYYSDKNQRIGDKAANTIVIENRTSTCSSCHEQVLLNQREIQSSQFTCPYCGELNDGLI